MLGLKDGSTKFFKVRWMMCCSNGKRKRLFFLELLSLVEQREVRTGGSYYRCIFYWLLQGFEAIRR